jgi:stearoyl-CoA desaturase (delta-9 desaturase)
VLAVALAVAAIGGVGTSVCYHRRLAHRSLRLNPVVESVLIFFTIFNASGAPLTWVAQHRNHHAKADTAEDISSLRYGGFWWAHIRWVYQLKTRIGIFQLSLIFAGLTALFALLIM